MKVKSHFRVRESTCSDYVIPLVQLTFLGQGSERVSLLGNVFAQNRNNHEM